MSVALEDAVRSVVSDFFAAVQGGQHALSSFCDRMEDLNHQLEAAANAGTISQQLLDLARSNCAVIVAQGHLFRSHSVDSDEVVHTAAATDLGVAADMSAQQSCPRASVPLLRYVLANICHPYPDSAEKERVAEEVRQLGWRDFDKRKFEDWLNRKRHQIGFVTILQDYCHGDRDAMRQMCHAALFGPTCDLPDGLVEDVEDMRDLVQSQYDELADDAGATWVDDLTSHIQALLHDGGIPVASGPDPSSWDDSSDTSDDESASECSSNDDEEDEPLRCVIGAKRKLSDCNPLPSVLSRPLSRSPSMASSASWGSTACSLRSLSGSSMSSTTSVEPDGDDLCDRPAKRSRGEPDSFDSQPVCTRGQPEAMWTSPAAPPHPLFTQYRTKRKRSGDDLGTLSRSMKRSRYVALGVASQSGSIADCHLSSLSSVCSLDWAPVAAAAGDFDMDLYTVDHTQADDDDDESDDEDFAVLHEREDGEAADDISTWSKLQIDSILRMLLSTSTHAMPTPLVEPACYAFDVDSLGVGDVVAFEATLQLTPEALSAMFDSMNRPVVASAPNGVVPAEEAVVASSENTFPAFDVQACTKDASTTAHDLPTLLLDAFAPAVTIPVLTIDTSAPALKTAASETEECLSPPEESLSPTSSSASERDSPPALSDDSGSSSRSSSVESDSEQDSLLLSPAALSADYSRLNDELSVGKASNADPSLFQVEFGALAEVTTANELGCASELLERYLNDQMTWA